jgi:hypothetical protein
MINMCTSFYPCHDPLSRANQQITSAQCALKQFLLSMRQCYETWMHARNSHVDT